MIDLVVQTDLEIEEMIVIIQGVIEVTIEIMVAVVDPIIDMMIRGMTIEGTVITEMIVLGDATIVILIEIFGMIEEKRLKWSLNPKC